MLEEPTKQAPAEQSEVLTAPETMRLLRMGKRQLYTALNQGEIPGVKIGGKWYIPREQLMRILGAVTSGAA